MMGSLLTHRHLNTAASGKNHASGPPNDMRHSRPEVTEKKNKGRGFWSEKTRKSLSREIWSRTRGQGKRRGDSGARSSRDAIRRIKKVREKRMGHFLPKTQAKKEKSL